MIFSLEMDSAAVMRKFDLMAINDGLPEHEMVHSIQLKGLDLDEKEMKRWESVAAIADNAKNSIAVIDEIGKPTVERVYAEAVRRKPDVVMIDYISLMETPRQTDNMWADLTRLTRQLKLMARTLHIPVWGLAQTNIQGASEGAQLHNIAYSRSIGQDSDIVLGLFCNEEMMRNRQMQIRMLKNRDGRPTQQDMLWRPDIMQFEPWQERHLFQAAYAANQEEATKGLSGGV
jgi:replicative DNA helicase